jgi:hypothetical protein
MRVSCIVRSGTTSLLSAQWAGRWIAPRLRKRTFILISRKEQKCSRSLLTWISPSRIFPLLLTAGGVNGPWKAQFTLWFTDPFTSKAIVSLVEQTSCAPQDDGFGRGQNTGLGWSDPTLCGFQPPKDSWDRSSPVVVVAISYAASVVHGSE